MNPGKRSSIINPEDNIIIIIIKRKQSAAIPVYVGIHPKIEEITNQAERPRVLINTHRT
jgi:hypothetical protein